MILTRGVAWILLFSTTFQFAVGRGIILDKGRRKKNENRRKLKKGSMKCESGYGPGEKMSKKSKKSVKDNIMIECESAADCCADECGGDVNDVKCYDSGSGIMRCGCDSDCYFRRILAVDDRQLFASLEGEEHENHFSKHEDKKKAETDLGLCRVASSIHHGETTSYEACLNPNNQLSADTLVDESHPVLLNS